MTNVSRKKPAQTDLKGKPILAFVGKPPQQAKTKNSRKRSTQALPEGNLLPKEATILKTLLFRCGYSVYFQRICDGYYYYDAKSVCGKIHLRVFVSQDTILGYSWEPVGYSEKLKIAKGAESLLAMAKEYEYIQSLQIKGIDTTLLYRSIRSLSAAIERKAACVN